MDRLWISCLLVLCLALISVGRGKASTTCDFESMKGGGCPDLDACRNTCKPCYAGIGKVFGGCFSKGSGQPDDECRCYFLDGAPCIPGCPRRPPVANSNGLAPFTGGSAVSVPACNNGTHVILGR